LTEVQSANALNFNVAGSSQNDVDTNPATIINLNVPTTGTITDLNLSINLSTPYADDIDISLIHGATNVLVYDGVGDTLASFINATFDDEAVSNHPVNGTVDGTFKPSNALSAFDGQELSGVWQLSLQDTIFADDGTDLVSWSIQGEANTAAVPFEFSPTLGLLLVGSLFGSNHFYRKYKANKVVLLTE
jgi:subtilisin-like proprotein convertase family protein